MRSAEHAASDVRESCEMEKTGFWSRIGRLLKRVNGTASFLDSDDASEAARGTSAGPVERGEGNNASAFAGEDGSGNGRRRPDKVSTATLSPDLERLTLTVREFLDGQIERMTKMDEHFATLSDHLARTARAGSEQVDVLNEMNRRWEVETTARQSLDQKLAHLPTLADAQREMMVSISRHLEAGRESLDRETVALTELRVAVTAVGDATGASTQVVQQLLDQAEERERGTVESLHTLTKRLTVLGAVLVALVAVSALFAFLRLIR